MRHGLRLCLWLMLAAILPAQAGENVQPLPEPLSLADALRLARPVVPTLLRAEAGRTEARAEGERAATIDGLRLTAIGRLRAIQPSWKSANRDANDSSAHLLLEKRLYDGGLAAARRAAAGAVREAAELEALDARQQQRLEIMRAFFDVLLADLTNARDTEAMSVAFVRLDRARDRHELGQLSDVALLELDAAYQAVRRRQVASATRQRLARARLALAMGRPGELASDLVTPEIEIPESQEGDFDAFWQAVEAGHPRLRALKARLRAARQRLEAARHSAGPVLSAELEAAAYNRTTGSTHPLGGGLRLSVPLLDGGQRDAAVAEAQAQLTRLQAQWQSAWQDLRQQALEAWLRRDTLRADWQGLQVEGDYRELYLDRSRALYDLEVKTDLGDAMTRISEVRLATARVLFDWALNEARIEAMTGRLLEEKP